jgi:hypothetical protein
MLTVLRITIEPIILSVHCPECHYAECHYLNVITLSSLILNVITLSVLILNVIMLSVVAPLIERNTLAYHFVQHPSLPAEALNYKCKMLIEFGPDLFVQSIQQV